MNKTELLRSISTKTGFSQKNIEEVLVANTEVILETLKTNADEKVPVLNIGKFSVKNVAERSGVAALAGGKVWTKPAHNELAFKISKSVKEL